MVFKVQKLNFNVAFLDSESIILARILLFKRVVSILNVGNNSWHCYLTAEGVPRYSLGGQDIHSTWQEEIIDHTFRIRHLPDNEAMLR